MDNLKEHDKYAVYVPTGITTEDGGWLEAGVYPAIADNRTYDTNPTVARVTGGDGEVQIQLSGFSPWETAGEGCAYAVYEDFKPETVSHAPSEERMLLDLEGLRPSDVSVAEYVHGHEGWGGFASLQEAWQTAQLSEWCYRFQTRKRMDQIYYRVMFGGA